MPILRAFPVPSGFPNVLIAIALPLVKTQSVNTWAAQSAKWATDGI